MMLVINPQRKSEDKLHAIWSILDNFLSLCTKYYSYGSRAGAHTHAHKHTCIVNFSVRQKNYGKYLLIILIKLCLKQLSCLFDFFNKGYF